MLLTKQRLLMSRLASSVSISSSRRCQTQYSVPAKCQTSYAASRDMSNYLLCRTQNTHPIFSTFIMRPSTRQSRVSLSRHWLALCFSLLLSFRCHPWMELYPHCDKKQGGVLDIFSTSPPNPFLPTTTILRS